MHIVRRSTCRVCGSPHLAPVIDLGDQHLQGAFVKPGAPSPPTEKIPTRLVRCDASRDGGGCGLVQLEHTVPPEVLYANYWYRSGTNTTMRRHLGGIVERALELAPSDAGRVLDIGCNDGTMLGFYPDSLERWGVDPSDIAQEIEEPIRVVNAVFPSEPVREALGDRRFDVITSIAMFYDLEDPVAFAREVRRLLSDEGIWIVEMSYLPLMLKRNSFDTICHEHLEYYSLAVIEHIANVAGLRVFRAELNGINGGSIRLYLRGAESGRAGSRPPAEEGSGALL
jgi:SAM-dependent methyltransferase